MWTAVSGHLRLFVFNLSAVGEERAKEFSAPMMIRRYRLFRFLYSFFDV